MRGGTLLVAKVHPPGIIEEDVEVRACLAGRLDGLPGKMDRAVDIGEAARLFAPERRGKHDVSQ